MKKNGWKILICLMCALLLVLTPGLGAKASEKLQYVYLTPSEDGKFTGVVIALDGEKPDSAVLDYGIGTVKASKISGNYLVFLVPGSEVSQNSLKKVSLTRGSKKETLDLAAFFRSSGTEMLDGSSLDGAISDNGIVGSRSRAASSSLSDAQKAQVESYTAANSSDIGITLAQAEIRTGTTASLSRSGNIVIVLDPGHGGSESGADRTWNGVTYQEKVINLKISKYTKEELEKYAGVTVYLTRSGDTTMSLDARVAFAAKKKATALVSQHINSTASQLDTVSGSLVFVATGNYRPDLKTKSNALANTILGELNKLGLKNLGLQVRLTENNTRYPDHSLADYYGIIRQSVEAGFPGIIVEHAFVNNPEDCKKYFGSDAAIKKLGVADATAIAKYYGLKLKSETPEPTVPATPTTPTAEPKPAAANSGTWKEETGKYYFEKSDGTLATGWLTLDAGTYYLNEKGYRTFGFATIDSKTYYFDKDGLKKTGLISVDGSLYWMDSRGVMVKGWFKGYDGNRYYSDTEGKLRTGFVKRGSKTYYFDPKTGIMKTGFLTVNRKLYYFRPSTGSMLQFGWVNIGGKRYHFHEDGHAQKGLATIGGERYFFRTDGSMIRSKWVYYWNSWYFASCRGKLYRNTNHYIGGVKYSFNSKGICRNKKTVPTGTYTKTTVLEQ